MMTNVSQIYIHESKIKLYTSSCRNIHVHNDIFFKLQLYWFFKTDHEQFDLLRRNVKEYSLLNRHRDPKCLLAEIIGCYLLIKKLFMINLKNLHECNDTIIMY